MNKKIVAIKNVDEKLYRKFKALAALKGLSLGEAFNQALSLWINMSERVKVIEYLAVEEEAEVNRRVYRELEDSLLKNYKDKYIAIAKGKFLGVFESRDEALDAVKRLKPRHAIITKVEPKKPRVIELGMSLFEVVR